MSAPTYKEGDLIHVPGNAFKVERVLGSGGMGSVYWVIEKQLDEPRVLKILHPDLASKRPDIVERFLREARAMTKVKHPNIARVIGLYTLSDTWKSPAYTMEALEGVSVADAMGQGIEQPHRALNVLLQTLAGLDAMHRRGLVHRDVKPQNLLLYKEDGRTEWLVKILDFGVIRIIADETKFEGFVGTFGYASDRMLRGEVAEPADDVWAAFLVFYELLTGNYAFAEYGLGRANALARVGKRPRALRDHGLDLPDVEELLSKALSTDERERFEDAFTAIKAVKALHAEYSARSREPQKVVTTTNDRRRAEEPITQALLSPTRPEQLPAWLEELRANVAAPAVVRAGDSDVDARGPTTPGPRRAPTMDERPGSTMPSAQMTDEVRAPPVEVLSVPPDARKLPTALPSRTPPMPDVDAHVEYVPSSLPAREPTARAKGPKILIVVHRDASRDYKFYLMDDYPIVLGRELPADVVIESAKVSQRHARIDHENGKYYLVDLGSTNGTFLGRDDARKKLEPRGSVEMNDEQIFFVGPIKIRVFFGTQRTDQEMGRLVERLQRLNARTSDKPKKDTNVFWLVLAALVLFVAGAGFLVMRR